MLFFRTNLSSLVITTLTLTTISCNNPIATNEDQAKKVEVKEDVITIVAVGDIMIGSAFPSTAYLPPNDAKDSFKAVEKYLKGDIVFGNLEGTLLDEDIQPKCKDATSKICYAFRMPERYGQIIKDAGFNVLSIANNHIGDFKKAGRKSTARILDSLGIYYAGQLNKPYEIFEKNGIKYGFIAFAPNSYTVSIKDIEGAKTLVKSLKEQTDIVIVSFHGGGEGTAFEHVTRQIEIYITENRGNVYEFSHAVINAGADIVLGHGPHVTRAVETYKGKFIAYSLGNFCTYGKFNLGGPNGIAPLMRIQLNKNGNFIKADVISVKQDKLNGLQLDTLDQAFYKIKNLTNTDFKGHQLDFSKKGTITLN